MPIERVRICSLRCLSQADLYLDPERNYLYGPNGAGKTSFLEGLYLLSRGRSFRTRHSKRLVQRGAASLAVVAEYKDRHGPRRVGVEIGAAGLTIHIDQETAGMAELARLVRADIIDPSVHRLVEGAPSERRRFFDWGVFHVERGFLDAWRRYRRALSQRNAALKAGAGISAVAAWDQPLLEAALAVDAARRAYLERLRPLVAELGRCLLGERIDIAYSRGWAEDVSLEAALAASWHRDAAAGFTQVGPHRSDLVLALEGGPLTERASRGQQKLAAAALVIAQARALASTEGEALLLLDDPAAELDKESLRRLLEVVDATPAQRVFTGLSESQLPPVPGFPVFHVEQGRIDRWYNNAV